MLNAPRDAGMTRLRRCIALLVLSACCGPAAADVGQQALERLSLRDAEALFVEHNRELQLARRAVEGSEADVISAGARPNPALSVGTSQISPSQGVGSGSLVNKYVDTVIGLSRVFERGNKRALRTGVAEANASASRSDRTEVERQQRIALEAAYFDLLLAQDKLAIIIGTASAYQKILDAAQLRLQAGDIAATDFARLNVDALRAQNDTRVARAEAARAQFAVSYLIGAEREVARIRASDAWPEVEPRQPVVDFDTII